MTGSSGPCRPRAVHAALPAVLLAAAFAAPIPAQQSVEGVLEPVLQACEQETHRIVEACTGAITPVLSSWTDLAAHSCRHVAARGSEIGLFCPALDLRDLAETPPACPIEVRNVLATPTDAGVLLGWDAVPCAQSYDVIYGVLGIPANGGCRGEADCGVNQYCHKFSGDCASLGQCRIKPTACTAVYDPVCGCDGVSYGNSCEANYRDMTVACRGLCPCPAECTDPSRPCLEEGPVACWANDFPESRRPGGTVLSLNPPVGQIYFYLIRATGPGDIGVTTYGYTEPDRRERFFAGDCPR